MSSLDDFARAPLLFGPSPVHRLDRLSEHLGGQPALNGYAGAFETSIRGTP